MELKLNISKKGLNTSTEVIDEEYTLNYGHVFRGLTAYEQAVKGGFQGSEEEFEAYVGSIGRLSEDAKDATNKANIATSNANVAMNRANSAATRAENAVEAAENAISEAIAVTENAEIATDSATNAAIEARDAIAEFEGRYDDFVLKEQGKGLSTNDYTNADKAEVAKVKDKQDTLTLTTKSNGNIVIGNLAGQSKEFMPATPSGDPMHYAYEALGARWNANTGYWEFYDMKDITNIEMSRALARGSWYAGPNTIGVLAAFNPQSLNAIRFNVARTGAWGVTQDMDYFATTNSYIEFVNMTHDNNLVAMPFTYVTYLNESFNGCSNLRRIYGELELSNVNGVRDAFKGCEKLESVMLYGLKDSISFADSPLLSKESLLYMIENCASDVLFTITLHQDAYMTAMSEYIIIQALENHPNVTLASA